MSVRIRSCVGAMCTALALAACGDDGGAPAGTENADAATPNNTASTSGNSPNTSGNPETPNTPAGETGGPEADSGTAPSGPAHGNPQDTDAGADETSTAPETDPDLPTMAGDGKTEFVSDLALTPSGGAAAGRGSSGGVAVGGAAPGAAQGGDTTGAPVVSDPSTNGNSSGPTTPAPSPDTPVDPARAIAEADVVQVQGDTLYALSAFNGLSVIDISDTNDLKMQGLYHTLATPFEMYLQDKVVVGLFNDYSTYVYDDATASYSWQSTSSVQALDTTDPADIKVVGKFEVPGQITDSRLVGNVMYLVTQQYQGCWQCDPVPNTTVTSFDVSDPTQAKQIAQLQFSSPPDTYYGDRTIAVTDQRIYISGWEYRQTSDTTYTGSIQVVDISDPGGALTAGAKFDIGGQVSNRWQMDEYDGVLRVISQPGGWGSSNTPVVETFDVNSASDIQPLGSLAIQLPQQENLQSVRFDGPRAYAVTVYATDPLFTFDLSDPANPRQMGDIVVPGSIYYMEPRGERVYAIGFDNTNEAGALTASLFDVSDLEAPALLERVNFGGDWGSFAEDQDRIHKSFRLLDQEGLIVIPFSGWEYDELGCQSVYQSGIQLIDFTNDSLVKRGVAPSVGSARRALTHSGSLISVSDNAVQSFDIEDRDKPKALDMVDVARNISSARVIGDHLMRFGSDWWTNRTILDMTPVSEAMWAEPQAEINLSALFGENEYNCSTTTRWTGQVFVNGNYAYVPRFEQTYRDDQGNYTYEQLLSFYVVDMTEGDQPKPIGKFSLDPALSNEYIGSIVQTKSALLIGRTRLIQVATPDPSGSPNPVITQVPQFSYDVVDIRSGAAPVLASRFDVPQLMSDYGWGVSLPYCAIDMGWGWWGGPYYPYYNPYSYYFYYYYGTSGGYGNALVSGDVLASQHYERVDAAGRVKYYLDRLDVSDPANPVLMDQVNIPGTLVHFDATSNQILTLDYVHDTLQVDSFEACYQRAPYTYYDDKLGECNVFQRTLNSLVLDDDGAHRLGQVKIDSDWRTLQIAVSDDRVFVTQQQVLDATDTSNTTPSAPQRLKAYRTTTDAEFQEIASIPLEDKFYAYGTASLRARGRRAFQSTAGQMTIFDTTDATAPTFSRQEMPGVSCESLEVSGDRAYCALGQRGVEAFSL
ncbi:MAG TPA: beta-propeller domain-containing protein [Polyangiaceae bacterium]|nr:beta-propeller domain-containing protein [Polyangiaceae bacterium]